MIMADNFISGEVLSISAAGAFKDLTATYRAIIHIDDSLTLEVPIVEHVDIHRDYNTNTFDVVTIRLMLPLGDVVKKLYPKREKLKITLINKTLAETIRTTYVMILTKLDPHLKVDNYNNETHGSLNGNFTVIEAECKPLNFNTLKSISVGGVYVGTMKDVLISAITYNIAEAGLDIAVNVIEVNNSRLYEQIVIPTNVTTLNIVDYLQKTYGVYNGGIGIYLQKYHGRDTLFIYPLYRMDLFLHMDELLQVTNVNRTLLNGIDSTYGMSGNTLKILVPKSAQVDDVGNARLLTSGTTVSVTDTHTINKRPIEVSEDKLKGMGSETTRIQTHKDVGENALTVHTSPTANNYEKRSAVLKNDNTRVLVTWSNSNARLIRPFMAVSFVKEKDGDVQRYNGVVTGCHIVTDTPSKMEATVISLQLSIEPAPGITNSSLSFSKLFQY
jgi:hypothetical protein